MWTAVAIGGSALIGAGAGLWGASKASGAQADASKNALDYQKQTDSINRATAAPFVGAGNAALDRLGASYANPSNFTSSPDYKFAFDQGRSALENSAAAKGGLLGGNFARGATEYGQGFAMNYLDRYRAGNLGIASLGANAASGAANNASGMSGQIGGSYGNMGQATASGYVGGANAVTGSLGSGVTNYLFNNALNKSSYGNPGGSQPTPYNPAWNGGVNGSPY